MRSYADLVGADSSDLPGQIQAQQERVAERLSSVRFVVAVMSGKGGVGKSFVAATLAMAARRTGWRVALLDADLNGPTARRLLGIPRTPLVVEGNAVRPAVARSEIALMSMDLLLEEGKPLEWREPASESFVWRGTQERGALREFLGDVWWGERDLLLVDLPPGSQRLVELGELVANLSGVVVVTLPSPASGASVQRSMEVARRRKIPILGIVENMSGYLCPSCGSLERLFPGDAGARLAAEFQVPLVGRIPYDVQAAALADDGDLESVFDRTEAGSAIEDIASRLHRTLETRA